MRIKNIKQSRKWAAVTVDSNSGEKSLVRTRSTKNPNNEILRNQNNEIQRKWSQCQRLFIRRRTNTDD